MNRILFINGCIYLPGEHGLKRTFYLFDMMANNGCPVHFLTSNFNHYDKTVRDVNAFYENYPQYKNNVSFIDVKPYKSNISKDRFISNWKFESQAYKWIKNHKGEFDVIYVSLPTLHLAGTIRKFCKKNNIKIVIDVNDLWPEVFKLVFKNDFIYNLTTFPIKMLANRGYKGADCIISVSDEYKNRALRNNKKAKISKAVYLGAMLERFDAGVNEYAKEVKKPDGEFWISYAGTIGASYDIKTVIDAVKRLNDDGYTNIHFKILGQGPEEQQLKEHATKIGANNVEFLGFLEYEKMAGYLYKSDLMVNCLKKRAPQSVINKVSDYFSSSHPVINSCSSQEMRDMIESYKVGFNYEAENVDSIIEVILKLYDNKDLYSEMSKNSRTLAEEKFDRKKTHTELMNLLLNL